MREPRFTEEQKREIEQSKGRLDAWRAKFQFYPPLEEPEPIVHYPLAPPEHRLMNKLNQLESLTLENRMMLKQHLERKKRSIGKYD